MTTLSFTQDGTRYIAEATVNHPYALHLEREDSGKFMIYQRSTDTGQYVLRFESESAVASATLQEEEDAQ